MPRKLRSLGVTENQWQALQRLSGLKNPAPYGRELLQLAIYAAETDNQKNDNVHEPVAERLPEPTPKVVVDPDPRREEFDARWLEVQCDATWDDELKVARDWFISQNPGRTRDVQEENALSFIERAWGRGSMTKPAGWIISKYNKRNNEPAA